jgi:hypothetical protein
MKEKEAYDEANAAENAILEAKRKIIEERNL